MVDQECKRPYSWKNILKFTTTAGFCFVGTLILTPVESMAIKILACVGNSITSRGGDSGYVALLAKKLGCDYDVKNFGLNGRTMLKNGNVPYWKEDKFIELFSLKPDIITLMLGTNDSKSVNWSKYGKEFRADVQAMVDTLLSIKPNVRLLLALPPPAFKSVEGISGATLSNEILPILQSIAKQNGLEQIDANAPMNYSKLFSDGVHPTNEGYIILAEVFYKSLISTPAGLIQPYLSKASPKSVCSIRKEILNLSPRNNRWCSHSVIVTKESDRDIAGKNIFFLNGRNVSGE